MTKAISVLLLLAAVALTAWAWRRDASSSRRESAEDESEQNADCCFDRCEEPAASCGA